jgi:hypothetical protein
LAASLARPGRNATGFVQFEYRFSAKWLELLKQIAPSVARVAVMRDASITSGTGQFAAIQSVAPSFGVELFPVDVCEDGEIERALRFNVAKPPEDNRLIQEQWDDLVRRMIAAGAISLVPGSSKPGFAFRANIGAAMPPRRLSKTRWRHGTERRLAHGRGGGLDSARIESLAPLRRLFRACPGVADPQKKSPGMRLPGL